MNKAEFLATHPVFTYEEFINYLSASVLLNVDTAKQLLNYYLKSGRILRIRRGLYAVVPPGNTPENAPVDAFLVASHVTKDAVLAYHTALEFHGKAYSVFYEFTSLSKTKIRPFTFRGTRFRGVPFPEELIKKGQENYGVVVMDRQGLDVRVTGLERTMVDVMDKPVLGGGWEEIWRSLEAVDFFDLERLIDYALILNKATTIARVGFYLEQHQEALMVTDKHLAELRKHKPKSPHYMERGRRTGNLVTSWNLIVPEAVMERSWEEPL